MLQNNQTGVSIFNSGNLFDGTVPAATDVLVKYTYYGDANLDGKVDGSDYIRIDSGYLNHLTGWLNGDFNYDAAVDGSDYALIDNSFNTQGAKLASVVSSPTVDIKLNAVVKRAPNTRSFFAKTPIRHWLGLPSVDINEGNDWSQTGMPLRGTLSSTDATLWSVDLLKATLGDCVDQLLLQ